MSGNNKKDSFLKGAFILGVAGILIKVLGAFFKIPLGNLIGAEGMAYYQSAYTVYTLLLTLATAGFPTALAKLVSEKMAIGDYKGANKVFRVSYITLFITGIIGFSVFFFGAEMIVAQMDNPGAYYAMLAISPALLFVPVMSSYRGYFQGKRDMNKIAISQILEQIFRVILGLSLAFILMEQFGAKEGAAGAISGATIGSIASLLYLLMAYTLTRKERKLEVQKSKNFKEENVSRILKRLLIVAVPITIGSAVMPLVNLVDNYIVIDRLQAGGYSSSEALVLYGQLTGMAMSIINLPSVITVALSMSLVPAISAAIATKNVVKSKKDTKSAIKVTLLIVLPAAFGIASLATPIMELLYPNEPSSIGTILLFLTPCVVFLGLIQVMSGILQGMGKPMIPVIALSVGVLFKIVISYTLTAIPQINVLGSVLGTVSAYFVAATIDLMYVKKSMKIKFSIKDFVIKPLITVTAMFAMVKISYALLSPSLGNSLATIISILVGGLVYVVVLIGIGGISKDEILTMPKGTKIYSILKKVKLMK